ncbi:hypothetical protein CONPUDRAFT_140073 [Coniophora puteana RWD-64-598 SS2]|uniref:Uncharacterized protein n=1 Tax=Coniophora puteana (strain RWD-64-598) TaxID=741705 RepID=A0A5M3MA61_CONPW|nr:uncharacterized protein CONPUDRAFT_140073 [Coniophora puteana RWD-64-598 SS2]EIW75724.1 hypothetical protein CONPUDRAFT_140073 [Coniophora puteana RWD-64-598 SS2]
MTTPSSMQQPCWSRRPCLCPAVNAFVSASLPVNRGAIARDQACDAFLRSAELCKYFMPWT